MENLTPVQRVAVIAIGLALTLLVAMLVLPWVWKQISEWLPATERDGLGSAPVPLSNEPGALAAVAFTAGWPPAMLVLAALSPGGF